MTEQEPFWLQFLSNIIKNINDSRAAVNSSLSVGQHRTVLFQK